MYNKLGAFFVSVILLMLWYFYSPMNRFLTGFLKEDIHQFSTPVNYIPLLILKSIVITLTITSPCLFLVPTTRTHSAVEIGLFLAFLFSSISVLQFSVAEKTQMVQIVRLQVLFIFILCYFTIGFLIGGFWGLVGRTIFASKMK